MTATQAPALERVLRADKAAEHLDCTPETIYALVRDGKLRAIRVGRLVRIPESALAEFISGGGK